MSLAWVHFMVGATGFGGSIVWLRQVMVEQKRWLSAEEFNEAMSVSQFLPGPNVFNLMVVLARRMHGVPGVALSALAIMAMPFLFALALGTLYVRYGDLPAARLAMRGIAPVAAGLMLSMGVKIAEAPGLRSPLALVAVLTFVAVAFVRVPLPLVLLTMAPLGVVIALRRVH
jgi:chromate transporter